MRARILSLSFFLGSAAVAAAWLTLLPVMLRLIDALRRVSPEGSPEDALLDQVRSLLPFALAGNLSFVVLVFAIILWMALGRPLRRTEATVEQLGKLQLDVPLTAGGGPLLSRIQSSLRRMAQALSEEQSLTRQQMLELRTTNERLTRAQAELIASERLATVGRLAAGVAHEVGNPLSGMLGYISLVKQRASGDEKLQDYAGRMEIEIQRIDRIVRGLLDLGRPPQVTMRPVEIAPVVRSCVQLLHASPELLGIEIQVDVPDAAMALADPGPLSQVLINLLINAAQAQRGRGCIVIRSRTDESRLLIDLEDEGPGLSPEAERHLFEPFFTTKAAGEGSGLGLAISQHLARSMGGSLRAENRHQGGARFTLELKEA